MNLVLIWLVHAGIMTGFSSALLTRKSFLSGSARVGRTTNGGKTFALFKKAEKQAKKITGPAKQTAKKVNAGPHITAQSCDVADSLLRALSSSSSEPFRPVPALCLRPTSKLARHLPRSLAHSKSRRHRAQSERTSQHQRAHGPHKSMASQSSRTSCGCPTQTAHSGSMAP